MAGAHRSALSGLVLCLCVGVYTLGSAAVWADDPAPAEYTPEEFAPWMVKLRRGEIILFGSLPFSLFAVTLGYDTIRYIVHVNDSDAGRYAPWPFRSANPVPYTSAENIGVGIGVLVGSLAISVADFVIGEIRERRAHPR
jgi:hypothetical protein